VVSGTDSKCSAGVGATSRDVKILHERLPHSKLDFVDAGHFAYEDRAEEYAELILAWWNGGYEQA
jgi:pimeloyl-ACP methyl ester carboxylesterase